MPDTEKVFYSEDEEGNTTSWTEVCIRDSTKFRTRSTAFVPVNLYPTLCGQMLVHCRLSEEQPEERSITMTPAVPTCMGCILVRLSDLEEAQYE